MTFPCFRFSLRITVSLLPVFLVLALAGFTPGLINLAEAAQTPPSALAAATEPTAAAVPVTATAPAAVPATPASPSTPPDGLPPAGTPPPAPPATESTAPGTPPATAAPPAKAKKGAAARKKAAAAEKKASKGKYLAGEDPEYAKRCGWPVQGVPAPPGAILPHKRIVAYYGNPKSKKMGVLGEYPKDEMLQRLQKEVARWEKADPSLPVQPALQLVAVVAQGDKGKAGKYRMIMPDRIVNEVYDWAKEAHALFIIDIQTGHSNIRTILPRFEWLLKNPDVHVAMDPEFNLISSGKVPGKKIGTYDGSDVNYASEYLQELVKKYNLPPKVLIVHRFTRKMVTNAKCIKLRPDVQIVMNMDGWGAPWLKRDSYKDYIVKEPVEYTGFKLFYHNDTKKGDPLLTPQELLRLNPKPVYIQYQ